MMALLGFASFYKVKPLLPQRSCLFAFVWDGAGQPDFDLVGRWFADRKFQWQ
jgi:hypothetical protein